MRSHIKLYPKWKRALSHVRNSRGHVAAKHQRPIALGGAKAGGSRELEDGTRSRIAVSIPLELDSSKDLGYRYRCSPRQPL
jgi:hypothetical protein